MDVEEVGFCRDLPHLLPPFLPSCLLICFCFFLFARSSVMLIVGYLMNQRYFLCLFRYKSVDYWEGYNEPKVDIASMKFLGLWEQARVTVCVS